MSSYITDTTLVTIHSWLAGALNGLNPCWLLPANVKSDGLLVFGHSHA